MVEDCAGEVSGVILAQTIDIKMPATALLARFNSLDMSMTAKLGNPYRRVRKFSLECPGVRAASCLLIGTARTQTWWVWEASASAKRLGFGSYVVLMQIENDPVLGPVIAVSYRSPVSTTLAPKDDALFR